MVAPDTRDRFVRELVEAARALEDVEEAAPAEAWVSGVVAEWSSLGGSADELLAAISELHPLAASLIAWIAGGAAPVDGPRWTADVGTHEPVRAVEVAATAGPGAVEEVAIVLEYRASSGAGHSVSVSVFDGQVVDLAVGPAELADAVGESEVGRRGLGLSVSELSVDEAVARTRTALGAVAAAELSPEALLDLPLLLRRFGYRVDSVDYGLAPDRPASGSGASGPTRPARNVDDDHYAAEVVASALRLDLASPAPAEVAAALASFADRLGEADPDALVLYSVAGLPAPSTILESGPGLRAFLRLVGAYAAPADLSAHEPEAASAIAELEWADWSGAVIGLVRSGAGAPVDGDVLVTFVNRCPEVTTSIPASERARIGWAFEQTLYAWEVTGALDATGALTSAGEWMLPRAAIAAWTAAS